MFNNYLLMDTLTLASIFAFLVLISIIILSSEKSLAQAEPIQIISTRNHFNKFGNPLSNRLSYEPSPFDFQSLSCSQGEVVIYVHGVWTAKNKIDEDAKLMFENAPEIFDRVRLSLQSMEYRFPVIGFSWDSDTEIFASNGWDYAKIIARENGPKLAQFILDLKDNCPETNIRLIAHSLGARVVLSSLDNLNNNQRWNDNNFTIASVHLMGAAVDNEKISKSSFHTGDSHDEMQ